MRLVRGKYIPACREASYVSSSSLSAFRAAIVGAVWSGKMPLASTPAILGLLDGLVRRRSCFSFHLGSVSHDASVFGLLP